MIKKIDTQQCYELYACLPFVHLKVSKGIAMGPVLFWPAGQARHFVEPYLLPTLTDYLQSVTSLKAWSQAHSKTPDEYIDTVRLSATSLTCISIDPKVPEELRNRLLIDAIYLFFFCGAFSHLYASGTAPCFDVFTKIIPASASFLQDRSNWSKAHILEAQRKCPVSMVQFDEEMCSGLGHALACAYCTESCKSSVDTAKIQSLIRAIRYFVDRFFERFENLIGNGLGISSSIYEAEDIVFLATSYEALFDLDDEHPHIDLKHKLRPMLGLRYSVPVELLWLWVDGFFHLREQIVHGQPLPDKTFQANPNFAISYLYLGMKLFLYGVYWRLHSYRLIRGKEKGHHTDPLRFHWVQLEELLAYFWPEEALIHRIYKLIRELNYHWEHPELRHDLTLTAEVFLYIHERYWSHSDASSIATTWIPTPLDKIEESGARILEILDGISCKEEQSIHSILPKGFVSILRQRINP